MHASGVKRKQIDDLSESDLEDAIEKELDVKWPRERTLDLWVN